MVKNRAMLPPPYATFCGALHSASGLMIAIRSDEFEFGRLYRDEKIRFWRVIAHGIRVRGALADVRSFTFVNMHLVSDFADKVPTSGAWSSFLTGCRPPYSSRVISIKWRQRTGPLQKSCAC